MRGVSGRILYSINTQNLRVILFSSFLMQKNYFQGEVMRII